MNDRKFEHMLVECLDLQEQGYSVDEILSRYPEYAAELRPALELSTQLSSLPLAPSVAAKTSSREQFLAQARGASSSPPFSFWGALLIFARNWGPAIGVFILIFAGVWALRPRSDVVPADAPQTEIPLVTPSVSPTDSQPAMMTPTFTPTPEEEGEYEHDNGENGSEELVQPATPTETSTPTASATSTLTPTTTVTPTVTALPSATPDDDDCDDDDCDDDDDDDDCDNSGPGNCDDDLEDDDCDNSGPGNCDDDLEDDDCDNSGPGNCNDDDDDDVDDVDDDDFDDDDDDVDEDVDVDEDD